MPTYVWQCEDCKDIVELECRIADMDIPPEPGDESCVFQGTHNWVRTMQAPMVLKASYLDGQSRGEAWDRLKIAAKLDKEKYNLPPNKRGDIDKAIKEVKTIKKSGTGSKDTK